MKHLVIYVILLFSIITSGGCKKQKPPKGEYNCILIRTFNSSVDTILHQHIIPILITHSKKDKITIESGSYSSVLTKNNEIITGSFRAVLPTDGGIREYDKIHLQGVYQSECKSRINGTYNATYKYAHNDLNGNFISGEEEVSGDFAIIQIK